MWHRNRKTGYRKERKDRKTKVATAIFIYYRVCNYYDKLMVKYVKYDYNKKTKHGTVHVSRGLIPEKIWSNPALQQYVNSDLVFGYIGSMNRRKTTDRAVMKYFRDARKSDNFIINNFLINSRGRHMADMYRNKTESQIYRELERTFGEVKKKK
jgi:hypothetical protein